MFRWSANTPVQVPLDALERGQLRSGALRVLVPTWYFFKVLDSARKFVMTRLATTADAQERSVLANPNHVLRIGSENITYYKGHGGEQPMWLVKASNDNGITYSPFRPNWKVGWSYMMSIELLTLETSGPVSASRHDFLTPAGAEAWMEYIKQVETLVSRLRLRRWQTGSEAKPLLPEGYRWTSWEDIPTVVSGWTKSWVVILALLREHDCHHCSKDKLFRSGFDAMLLDGREHVREECRKETKCAAPIHTHNNN